MPTKPTQPKKTQNQSNNKERKPEVEHMLKVHEKTPFGSKVQIKVYIARKKPSGTVKTSLGCAVGLKGNYQQVLYVLFLNMT